MPSGAGLPFTRLPPSPRAAPAGPLPAVTPVQGRPRSAAAPGGLTHSGVGLRAGRRRLQRGAEQRQAEGQAAGASPPQLHVGRPGSAVSADGCSCDRPSAEERGQPGVACASPGRSLPPRDCRKPPPRPARTTGGQKPLLAGAPRLLPGSDARGGRRGQLLPLQPAVPGVGVAFRRCQPPVSAEGAAWPRAGLNSRHRQL